MRAPRFNHIFIGLMGLALLAALAMPRSLSDRARAQVQWVFGLVSNPIRLAADSIASRFRPAERVDTEAAAGTSRSYRQIAEENRLLRMGLASLTSQLQQLKYIDEERASLGSLRQLCRPMRVVGGDSGTRRSLNVQGELANLRPGMAAICGYGLVGRLDRVAWTGGAQVQLVTDRAFRATVRFGRYVENAGQTEFVRLGQRSGLVEGDGRDGMTVKNIPMRDVVESKLQAHDWVVLDDNEYPLVLQGYRVGEVLDIAPSRTARLFAEIHIRPVRDFQSLREVMILMK